MSTILVDDTTNTVYPVTNDRSSFNTEYDVNTVYNVKNDVPAKPEKPWRRTVIIVVDNKDNVIKNYVLSLVELRYWLLDLAQQFADGTIRSFMVYEKKGTKGVKRG